MIETLIEEELQSLQQKSLYRQIRTIRPLEGMRAEVDGQEQILFCGNDYLGLSRHPRVIEALKKAADQGVGSGASRLISGTTGAHRDLEEKIAETKGKPSALVYSSGYMANVGAITSLAGEEDLIVMDKLCHASIIDGARLSKATIRVFPHKNYKRCEEIFSKATGFKKKFLITESVFSMDGDLAHIETLIAIKEKYSALLLIDDAHATGVLGQTGKGALEDQKLFEGVDVILGTLSKATGCLGGFVASCHEITDYLINTSRPFIFATSLPPVLCAAIHEAFCVIESEPQLRGQLWQNTNKVYQGLQDLGFTLNPLESPIIPVILGEEKKALSFASFLRDQGFFIPAIRTPTVPKGQARLRVTLSALHEEDQIEQLLQAFEKAKIEVK